MDVVNYKMDLVRERKEEEGDERWEIVQRHKEKRNEA